MDVDPIDSEIANQHTTQQPRRRLARPVDDAHPFDLDSYIAGYTGKTTLMLKRNTHGSCTGRTAVDRLLTIIASCPAIAPQALKLAFSHLYRLRDPSLVQAALSAYVSATALPEGQGLPPAGEVVDVDTAWIEEVTKKNVAERTKLEVELKTYTNNMIKESIRVRITPFVCDGLLTATQMAHRDLGEHHRATGDFASALKHLTRSREFCSTSQHVLDMCLSVLEVRQDHPRFAESMEMIDRACSL